MAIKPPTKKIWNPLRDTKFEEVFKSHIRDLSIDLISNSLILTIDIKKRLDRWQFLRKKNNIINYALSIGGVLTGSRALRCYKYKNKHIFDRSPNDWDILVTEDMVFKIADKFGFTYNLIDKFISIKSDRWVSHSAYSGSTRLLKNDINLIIKDELSDFIEVDNIRINKLLTILNSKKELSMESYNTKHTDDLSKIITRINAIKLNG